MLQFDALQLMSRMQRERFLAEAEAAHGRVCQPLWPPRRGHLLAPVRARVAAALLGLALLIDPRLLSVELAAKR